MEDGAGDWCLVWYHPPPAPQLWRLVSKGVLRPDHPFALHKLLFQAAYARWDAGTLGPPPAWVPTPEGMAATNAARFMASWQGDATWQQLRTGAPAVDWDLLQRLSFSSPEAFWPAVLEQLRMRFTTPPARCAAKPAAPALHVYHHQCAGGGIGHTCV